MTREYIRKNKTLQDMWNALYALEDEIEKRDGLDENRRNDLQAGFEAGQRVVASAPAELKSYWVPAENPPEFECDVLAFCVNGEETRVAPCSYSPSGGFYDCVLHCEARGVTHWMEKPLPPEVKVRGEVTK